MTVASIRKQVIRYGDRRIEFELVVDSRRASLIRIAVDPMNGVRVFAPASAEASDVRAAVRRRARWINRQLGDPGESRILRRFVSGEQVLYLGRRYVLKVATARTVSVKMRGGVVRVEVPERNPNHVANALAGWYRDHAQRYFQTRLTEIYSPALDGGHEPPQFRLQTMTRRWGSCSPNGRLLLNPALIRAPRECIDYVLTHELCHIRHHSHGPAFKKLLRRRMPDWEGRKEFLEQLAHVVLPYER